MKFFLQFRFIGVNRLFKVPILKPTYRRKNVYIQVRWTQHFLTTSRLIKPINNCNKNVNQVESMNSKSKQSKYYHRAKSVRIRSLSGSYSVRMWEKAGQKNFECGHFLRSVPDTDSGPHYISKRGFF